MRGLTRFQHEELVTIRGVDYFFHSLVAPVSGNSSDPDDLQFLNARHRRVCILTPAEFLRAYHAGDVKLHRVPTTPGDTPGDDDDSAGALRRRWRHFWTTTFDSDPVKKSTKKLAEFIDKYCHAQPDPIDPPSPETLRTWLRVRGKAGDRRPRHMGDRKRIGTSEIKRHATIEAIWAAASRRYWSNYKVTHADVVEEVNEAVRQANQERMCLGKPLLKAPGRTTMWRWLQQEKTYSNVCTREGRHIAERQFKVIKGSLEAKRLLDIAIIDQKRMDVHVADETGQFCIGRPWLAVLLDVKSRMVLGYTLSFEDPSVLSAMACVRMALKGAPNLKSDFPSVDGEWESFGVPRTILADNAWENVGSSFSDACEDHGISLEWAPVRRPEYKGILERFFSTLDLQLVHKLPGAVTSNPHNLAKRRIDPQADARLTLAELEEFVARYVVDVYSTNWHDALDAAPLKVWRDRADMDGIELAHDLSAIDAAMGTLVPDRRLNHAGVEFLGLQYRSDAVEGLLADLLPLQGGQARAGTADVKIKYHPENLANIFVWNEKQRRYITLPCTTPQYARGLSRRVHEELRSRKRAVHQEFITEENACSNKAELLRDIAASYDQQSVAERRRSSRSLAGAAAPQMPPHIPTHALGARVGANKPEKAAVRSRSSKNQKKRSPDLTTNDATTRTVVDPFADIDWEAEVECARGRLT